MSLTKEDGSIVTGESNIPKSGLGIEELLLDPQNPIAHPKAVTAIREADIVVMGPGSLFTSILPNLMVPGIAEAIHRSKATTVYVCNVATQQGETDNFTVADHVDALQKHTDEKITDFVIADAGARNPETSIAGQTVVDDGREVAHATILHADIADPAHPVRHSSEGLAGAVMSLYHGNRRLRTQRAEDVPVGSAVK